MRSQTLFNEPGTRQPSPQVIRLKPILDLMSGQAVGALCQSRLAFEERALFGPMAATGLQDNPSKWTANQIDALAKVTDQSAAIARPVIIPIPMAALAHSNTAIACDAAVRRTAFCQQELVLELADAAFAGDRVDHIKRVANLRKRGFKIGVDMRKSWQAPLDGALRILVDYVRVDADAIATDTALETVVLVAKEAGITVIADNAKWRDGEHLSALGITAGINPRSDA